MTLLIYRLKKIMNITDLNFQIKNKYQCGAKAEIILIWARQFLFSYKKLIFLYEKFKD